MKVLNTFRVREAGSHVEERDPVRDLLRDSSLSTLLVTAERSAEEAASRTIEPPTMLAPEHPAVKLEAPQGNWTTSVACKMSCVSELQDNLGWKGPL